MPPKKKKVSGFIKLQIQAGAATPAPPVGPALGQPRCQHHGVRQGVQRRDGVPAWQRHPRGDHGVRGPLVHLHHQDPSAAELIKKAAGVPKGSGEPHKTKVGHLTAEQVREIATLKMEDLNANDVEQAAKIIAGTARSMGVTTG